MGTVGPWLRAGAPLSDPPVSAFRWYREYRFADRARSASAPVQPPWRHTRRAPRGRRAWQAVFQSALVPSAAPDPVSLCRATNRRDWQPVSARVIWGHPASRLAWGRVLI